MPTEAENMEAHSLMLELCHQLGAEDGDDMFDMLFLAVADARRYRWLRDRARFIDLGTTQLQGAALDHACDKAMRRLQNAPTSERGSEADASDNYPVAAAPSNGMPSTRCPTK